MRVLIGLKDGAGQPVLDIDMSEEEFLSLWKTARESDGFLDVTDKKRKRAVISGNAIAYVQFEENKDLRVGFGRA